MFPRRSALKALTLIELLISMVLISGMLIAAWAIYGTGFKVLSGQLLRYDIKDDMSYAFTTMTKELQQASLITAATAISITFMADLNGDGINETIQYAWSGTAGAPLNRVSDGVTVALMRSVESLSFSYYALNDNTTALSSPVTVADIRLVAVDARAMSGDETFHLRTKVFLRCI